MNDSEFIELLNLYLDHEISAADAARLESEVQTHAARRRIYHQYCRMQKGCKLAAADFQIAGDLPAANKVVAFDPAVAGAAVDRRRRTNSLYTVGTFAALAACVTIIFVGRSRQAAEQTGAAHVAQSVDPASNIINPEATFVASQSAAPLGLVARPQRPPAALMRDPLLLTGTTQADAVLAAAVQQANDQLAWLESMQLPPLPQRTPVDLHFAASLRSEERPLGGRPATPVKAEEAVETVVFRITK